MRKLKSSVLALTLGAVLSTSLILGGCNEKNKGNTVKIEKITKRTVNANEAEQALKLMALFQSGQGDVSWTERKGENGNYTFYNFVNESKKVDKGRFASVELKGVHMEAEKPAFDQMIFNDFSGTGENDIKVSLSNITLTQPSVALSDAIARSFNGVDDAFDNIEGELSFRALSFDGLTVNDKDGVFSLDQLKLGKSKDETGYFSMQDLDMDMQSEGKKIVMKLGSVNVTGVNLSKYQSLIQAAMDEDGDMRTDDVKNLLNGAKSSNPDYRNFSVNNFNMNAAGLKINLDSMTGEAKKKGGKIIMNQTMSPLTITPPKGTKDKDLQKFVDGLASFGYDELEIIMEQNSVIDDKSDTMVVSDSYIQLKDGFKFSYDYDIAGFKAVAEKAMSLNGGNSANPLAILGMMSELKFNHLRVALKDESIVDRGFKFAAEQQGGTPQALRMQAKLGLAFLPMMAKNEGQQTLADDLSKALGTLLDDGGTLVIELSPKEAVDFNTILQGGMGGDIDVEALGLTIATK